MAKNVNLLIEKLMDILYVSTHHQQECTVIKLILCNATFYLSTLKMNTFYFYLINFFGQYFLLYFKQFHCQQPYFYLITVSNYFLLHS